MNIDFKGEAYKIKNNLIKIRRQIHQNPELGFCEFETAKLIKTELERIGIEYTSEIAKTGIFATVHGTSASNKSDKHFLIRADMDALPLQEDTTFEFKSQNDEIFHACGHDTHVTSVLGAAEIIQKYRAQFSGKISFVFQPAEEGSKIYDPTGNISGGALPMIIEAPEIFGSQKNPRFDGILALHIVSGPEPSSQVGHIGVSDGKFTGSADEFLITIKGEGGHASAPHNAVDPIFIASQVYNAIQGFITRKVDPIEPVVFTIGKIDGGFRQNIISETCFMTGTLRTLNSEIRDMLKTELPVLIKSISKSFGGDANIEIYTGYPVGSNDKIINDHIRKVTKSMYGENALFEVDPVLGAEDFYEFSFKNTVPISMFWLGGANQAKGWIGANHSNYFSIDEDAIPIGTSILAATAFSFMNSSL